MLQEPAKDFNDEDAEEVVLSRWGKIKQWIEIAMATKKVAMLIWGLLFAAGGSVVVGQATDTRPIRDAAVAIGILDEKNEAPVTEGHNHDAILDELMNLQDDIAELEARDSPQGIAGIAGPPGPPGKDGKDGVDGHDGQDGAASVDALRAEIEKLLPPNHKSLH